MRRGVLTRILWQGKLLFVKAIIRKSFGIILIILGIVAILTPFTPGAWLIFVGAELLGLRLLLQEKLLGWRQKIKRKP